MSRKFDIFFRSFSFIVMEIRYFFVFEDLWFIYVEQKGEGIDGALNVFHVVK